MMDCNKEEAIRAKDIATRKMQNKDFIGARKMALRAQQLFPDLENLSQMLTVCEVHSSAAVKVNGETNWYGVLQLEPTADDLSIKKQYRKLALLLHPDKNQFTGAEEAFKLVGEAHMTLSDRGKRSLYDMKRNGNIKTALPRQPAQQFNKTSFARTNFTAVNFSGLNQQQPPASHASQTFWTICSSCNMRYQYFRNILNKTLRCQNCLNGFVAYDINAKVVPPNANPRNSCNNFGIPQQYVPGHHSANATGGTLHQQSRNGGPGLNSDHRGGPTSIKVDAKVDVKDAKPQYTSPRKDKEEKSAKMATANVNHKRVRKSVAGSSISEDSGVEDSTAKETAPNKSTAPTSAPRRSTRFKEKVAYNEAGSEDDDNDFVNPPHSKKLRGESSSNVNDDGKQLPNDRASRVEVEVNGTYLVKEDSKEEQFAQQKGWLPNGNEEPTQGPKGSEQFKDKVAMKPENGINASSNESLDRHTFSYPDPEFFDFDESRSANRFAVDQIWAVYDNVDGMPRFYARIKKVYGPDFRLRFTWLEHSPGTDAENAWSDGELPVACGNFSHGYSEHTEDRLMFSHIVPGEWGRKNSYEIYPRKGEVWALFKDWSIEWSSDADNHKVYQYELVEVISDFAVGTGISVVPLVKVEGFVSLFVHVKEKGAVIVIPDSEMLRFSHYVPAYRLSGTEKEGVPEGSLELDPASLPANFQDAFPSISPGIRTTRVEILDEGIRSCSKTTMTREDTGSGRIEQKENKSQIDNIDVVDLDDENPEDDDLSQTSSPVAFDYPNPEFNDFSELKAIEKFQRGQIWALYCDIDGYPKYYARVRKVETEDIRIHVLWLEACPVQEEEQRWSEEKIPLSCGTFEVTGEKAIFESTDSFSHLVDVKQTHKKNQCVILPRCGEIWAIYKNWKAGWSHSDLKNCQYDVVQVVEATVLGVKVVPLTKLPGYNAVFKAERDEKPQDVIEIPFSECIRFSHQIPASKLTTENGGKLRGYWELDTASVPQLLLSKNS